MSQSTVSIPERSEPPELRVSRRPPGLTQRNGVWQLRIGVPSKLAHLYPGPDAFRESLRTRDREEAITMAHEIHLRYRKIFGEQEAAEVIRRAPPVVPLTRELEVFLTDHAQWLPLETDDTVRFTPAVLKALPPRPQFLSNAEASQSLPEGDLNRWDQLQAAGLELAKADLAAGRLERIETAANATLRSLGVRVDWSQPQAKTVLIRIARAQVRASQQALERGSGQPHETPAMPQAPSASPESPVASTQSTTLTLRDVVPDWITRTKARENAKQRTDKALRLWEEAVGAVPLDKITKATGAAFVTFLLDGARTFGSSTAANHAAAINALMNVAKKVGKVERNPLDLTFKITDAEEREQWTTEELRVIFNSRLFSDDPGPQPVEVDPADARLWLLQLLWSGARAGEIAQARVEDVQQRDGVLCLQLTPEAGTTKDQRKRWLPIAQALQPLYAAQLEARKADGKTVLFPSFHRRPGTMPGDMAGRWFRQFRETHGLPPGALNGSHRFRHSVSTRLAELGVGQEVGDQITGHSSQGSTRSRVYTKTIHPSVLAEAVERMCWQWPRSNMSGPSAPQRGDGSA